MGKGHRSLLKQQDDEADNMRSSAPKGDGVQSYVLDEQVGFILRQVQQRHTALFTSYLGGGLTPTQWAVVAKLAEVGDLSQNLLGRQTAMDNVTIKGVVDRLVKRGLVVTKRDVADPRRFSISLSPEGRAVYAEGVEPALRATRETLEPLDKDEREELLCLLSKLR